MSHRITKQFHIGFVIVEHRRRGSHKAFASDAGRRETKRSGSAGRGRRGGKGPGRRRPLSSGDVSARTATAVESHGVAGRAVSRDADAPTPGRAARWDTKRLSHDIHTCALGAAGLTRCGLTCNRILFIIPTI